MYYWSRSQLQKQLWGASKLYLSEVINEMANVSEKEFCLLTEPWISVLFEDCSVHLVSLLTFFAHAHEYRRLAGETSTQDVAMLRFLLAIVHTALSPVNDDGDRRAFTSATEALTFYRSLWERKKFPADKIRAYLMKWEERFYLFHPDRPFYQVPEAIGGTKYDAAKLNGEIAESGNSLRIFASRNGYEKTHLEYAEAARWLLHLNAFDDNSAKPKQKGLPSPGTGWLGKLGLIYPEGQNLFETIVFNLVLFDKNEQCWNVNRPCWELDYPRTVERCEIPVPDNQATLLTLQSRRILLLRSADAQVSGYRLLGGDFFDKTNAFVEQMTIWRHVPAKGNEPERDIPIRHNPQKQIWREFSSIIAGEGKRCPGVVDWMKYLQRNEISVLKKDELISYRVVSTLYGDKDFFPIDIYSDSLCFYRNLLDDLACEWREQIVAMITLSSEVAKSLGYLKNDLYVAGGGDVEHPKTNAGIEEFFFAIDLPFRRWLSSLDRTNNDCDITLESAIEEWKSVLKRIAMQQAKSFVDSSGIPSFAGKTVKVGDLERHYSSPEAFLHFQWRLKFLLKKGGLNGKSEE